MAKEKFGWIQLLKIVCFKIKLLNVYEDIIRERLYRVKYWMLYCFNKGKTLSNTVIIHNTVLEIRQCAQWTKLLSSITRQLTIFALGQGTDIYNY